MQELWMSNATYLSQGSWKIAAQNRFRLAFDRFKSDGQHDASTFKLSHLHLLHIASPINKDVFTTGIAVTTTYARKVAEHARYSILFREKDVHICPVSALAFYLLARWSVCTRSLICFLCRFSLVGLALMVMLTQATWVTNICLLLLCAHVRTTRLYRTLMMKPGSRPIWYLQRMRPNQQPKQATTGTLGLLSGHDEWLTIP